MVMGGASGRARDDYAVALLEHYLPPAAPVGPRAEAADPSIGEGSAAD